MPVLLFHIEMEKPPELHGFPCLQAAPALLDGSDCDVDVVFARLRKITANARLDAADDEFGVDVLAVRMIER